MSPYRVLAKNDKQEFQVLAAKLVIDKLTASKKIYILEKILSEADSITPEGLQSAAYSWISRSNSTILAAYHIFQQPDSNLYKIITVHESGRMETLKPGEAGVCERTYLNCLIATMRHYCQTRGYEIVSEF